MRRLVALTLTLLLPLAAARAAADFDLASAANQLGLQLYRALAASNPNSNLVLSPYSIETALTLAYAGADGSTRSEMSLVLGFPIDDTPLAAAAAALRRSLDQVVEKSKAEAALHARMGTKADPIEWHAASRLYGRTGYAFRESFLTLLKDGYDAPLESMPFQSDPDGSRIKINEWIETQTRNKIRDLIPRGGVTADTRLVLANALYLKAPWQRPFLESLTKPEAFRAASGTRPVLTMQRTGTLGYSHEENFTVVALAYEGEDLQFVIVLPDDGASPDAIAAKLAPADFARWANSDSGQHRTVHLLLPKFRVEAATMPLGRILRAQGLRSAFDEPRGTANFERMAPRRKNDQLALSDIYHQTFIAVDEKGTEAAAATATVFFGAAAPRQPIEVRVDRPFLFAIQHRSSGVCLFLGRISDPR